MLFKLVKAYVFLKFIGFLLVILAVLLGVNFVLGLFIP